jgi:hypothetical protein
MKKGSTLKIATKKVYSLNYLLQNPPQNARGLNLVWQSAVMSYFSKQGFDFNDKRNYTKLVEGMDFSQIVTIFKKLAPTPKKVAAPKKKKTA